MLNNKMILIIYQKKIAPDSGATQENDLCQLFNVMKLVAESPLSS